MRRPGKSVYPQGYRGFESLPLRQTMKIDKKLLLILTLIVVGVFASLALITRGGLFVKSSKPSPETNAYCNEEFLEETKSTTPSSNEQVNRYLSCGLVEIFLKDNVDDSQVLTFVDALLSFWLLFVDLFLLIYLATDQTLSQH